MDTALLHLIGPCGLYCGACLAYGDGPIAAHARGLEAGLGPNFATYAERFTALEPVFEKYAAFQELLAYVSKGVCGGCRTQGCLFKQCRLPGCVKAHEVDFCFQCAAFPCEEHGLPPRLEACWKKNNELMRVKGLREYFEHVKTLPRYP